MPIPGLTRRSHGRAVIIGTDAADVDLAALLGNPSGPVTYRLIIPAGVTVSGSASTEIALDASGLHVDSFGTWTVDGDILGAGGKGGDGGAGTSPFVFQGGGGGGGAGVIVGAKGDKYGTGTDGDPGLRLTGGAFGANGAGDPGVNVDLEFGADGGDAVALSHVITVALEGAIGGGGGGGRGGGLLDATAGGDIGVDGDGPGSGFGTAGYAIRYSGSGDATITGAGTTHGTIG